MKKFRTKIILGTFLTCLSMSAATYTISPKIESNPAFPTNDVIVSSINVLDYDSEANLGTKDVTALLQGMLDELGDVLSFTGVQSGWRQGGGVLYLPAGVYKISSLSIPRGVTLRGDWTKPVKGQPITGTILAISNDHKGLDDEYYSALKLSAASMVQGVAIWYPDQSAFSPVAYPPTINLGAGDFSTPQNCAVRNVTLVNPWTGLVIPSGGSSISPFIDGVYGTPLHTGIVYDNTVDLGHVYNINFAPEYWAGSGLAGANNASAWLQTNAVAIDMRRNDWSIVHNVDIERYRIGLRLRQSPEGYADNEGEPNGHYYNMTLSNCRIGISIEGISRSGLIMNGVSTPGCNVGIYKSPGRHAAMQFTGCDISGKLQAVFAEPNTNMFRDYGNSALQFEQCTFTGPILINGGEIIADNCTFEETVEIGRFARAILTSNTYNGGSPTNNSLFTCAIDNTHRNVATYPAYTYDLLAVPVTKPAASTLYLAANYGASGVYMNTDFTTASDNTTAIQNALNAANANGGGIVYLGPGHFRCNGALTIPTGVELRGASDNPANPIGQGTTIEVYYGQGSISGTPFITMQPSSGIRGIAFDYPEQNASCVSGSGTSTTFTPKQYSYTIRCNSGCYIVNVGFRGVYGGIDAFTNRCDNHYIDHVHGQAFKSVIHVGNQSTGGTISNFHFNYATFVRGKLWSYGKWDCNGEIYSNDVSNGARIFTRTECDFITLGDCANELLVNNFLYGSRAGYIFANEGGGASNPTMVGNAIDGCGIPVLLEKSATDINYIGGQMVSISAHPDDDNTQIIDGDFVRSLSTFNRTINFFGSDWWGHTTPRFATLAGGTVNFICANIYSCGKNTTWNTSGSAKVNINNAAFYNPATATGASSAVTINSAVYSPKGSTSFGQYNNVLSQIWPKINSSPLLDRTNWHATAHTDTQGKKPRTIGSLVLGWTETATGDSRASRGIDGDNSTKWCSSEDMRPFVGVDAEGNTLPAITYPQYYSVSFKNDYSVYKRFNTIVLDTHSDNHKYYPKHYIVQVVDDTNGTAGLPYRDSDGNLGVAGEPTSHKWRTVAEADGASCLNVLHIPTQTTYGVRVIQTGLEAWDWRIEEFWLADFSDMISDAAPITEETGTLALMGRTLIISSALADENGITDLNVYDVNGRCVMSLTTADSTVDLDLTPGTYVARAGNATIKFNLK